MSSGDHEEFLQQPYVAVLATVDGEGRPHAMPIWYLYEDGVFIMSAGHGSQKHRNIERNPQAALVVDKRDVPYYAVMVRGAAEIGPPLDEAASRRMAERYLGEQEARRYLAATAGHDSISIRLRPADILEFHGRAGKEEG